MKKIQASMPQALLRGLGGILCFVLISFAVFGSFFFLPANIHYHVTEKFIFSGNAADTPVSLGLMLPKSGPYQVVENIESLWSGSQQVENYDFVDILKLSGVTNSDGNLEAIIEYDIKLPKKKLSWIAPVERFQRLPQVGIESESECIQKKAVEIGSDVSGKGAYEIYSFVIDYLTYAQKEVDCTGLSAVKAFEIGECVCAGYARLMTALCRASGIPAQMMLGLVYPDPMFRSHASSFPHNPEEAHAWVEYYSEGSWKMADPTWGASYLKFMQFDRNDGRHLVYGELEQILAIDAEMEKWALEQAEFPLGEDATFRYFATSDSKQVLFTPVVEIQRKWDGRWLNTLVVCGIVTWILCKYREKIFGSLKNES